MKNLKPFPCIDIHKASLEDGCWVQSPHYCKKRFSEKCLNFYKSIHDKPGPHTCPCGLSCYVKVNNKEKVIYTGIRINSFFDRKKTRYILGQDYSPQFPLSIFEGILYKSNELDLEVQGVLSLKKETDKR